MDRPIESRSIRRRGTIALIFALWCAAALAASVKAGAAVRGPEATASMHQPLQAEGVGSTQADGADKNQAGKADSPKARGPDSTQAADSLMRLASPAFPPRGTIPAKHTCKGADLSPTLRWAGIPRGAQSLCLIVDDPDAPDPKAPKRTWVHWVLYNLPPDCPGLPEGVGREGLPPGTLEGKNDWKRAGYGGPCPPIGRHRYFFKLYALDARLPDLKQPTKDKLLKAIEGHVIARAELIGTYEKGQR